MQGCGKYTSKVLVKPVAVTVTAELALHIALDARRGRHRFKREALRVGLVHADDQSGRELQVSDGYMARVCSNLRVPRLELRESGSPRPMLPQNRRTAMPPRQAPILVTVAEGSSIK